MTSSGDGTAHIWQCAVHLTNESSSGRMASSEDELDPLERESNQAFGKFFNSQCFKIAVKVSFLRVEIFLAFLQNTVPFFNERENGIFFPSKNSLRNRD